MDFNLLGADFPHDIAKDVNPHDCSILDTLDEASLTQLDALATDTVQWKVWV